MAKYSKKPVVVEASGLSKRRLAAVLDGLVSDKPGCWLVIGWGEGPIPSESVPEKSLYHKTTSSKKPPLLCSGERLEIITKDGLICLIGEPPGRMNRVLLYRWTENQEGFESTPYEPDEWNQKSEE